MKTPKKVDVAKDQFGFFKLNVNVSALIFSLIITFASIKFLSFLPEKYYFTFSRVVNSQSTSAFIVQPSGVSLEKYCEILKEKNYLEKAKYEYDASGDTCNIMVPEPRQEQPEESPRSEEETETAQQSETGSQVDEPSLRSNDSPSMDLQEEFVTKIAFEVLNESQQKDLNATIRSSGQFNIWMALAFKLLPAFIAGFLSYTIWKENALIAAPIGAAMIAFILCWPIITLWDVVVDPDFRGQQNMFYALYGCYVAAYYALAKFGAHVGRLGVDSKIVKTGGVELDISGILSSFVASAITSFLTYLLTQTLAST